MTSEPSAPSAPWKDTAVFSRHNGIAAFSGAAIAAHLALRFIFRTSALLYQAPLVAALALGVVPLLYDLFKKLLRREWGSDLLAGIAIVASLLLREYLAGAIIVLMASGGAALEAYAVRNASRVLEAIARRMPSIGHRKQGSIVVDMALADIVIGDTLVVFPHEICPVDGVVLEGRGVMDESFLTGEPFHMSKTPGSEVISGALNGESALTIRASKLSRDSRYAKIMEVLRVSEQRKPRLRRLGDQLGAYYTPLALGIAGLAWAASGSAQRFLAVVVIATPCPLLIGIPVAIIGAVSLCARYSIVIKNPAVLEQLDSCRTVIFDKTGTLTYGQPKLTETLCAPGVDPKDILRLAASLEQYSKHPLAEAVLTAAREARLVLASVTEMSEKPGLGLEGLVEGARIQIASRSRVRSALPAGQAGMRAGKNGLPPAGGGLECFILKNGAYAAMFRFRDKPRVEGMSFIGHLGPKHRIERELIVSGDRESEVRYLAEEVGISEVYAEKSPEEKLAIVREEARRAKTLYLGDGINDAPALMAATVGIAIGRQSDITTEAAGIVIMDSSLKRVDELMHIGRRMRAIALQSAAGGMALSLVGMLIAAGGHLTPVAGAILQEIIDLLAILNALRAAFPPKALSDF